MSKSVCVFNLLERLLPIPEQVVVVEPGEIQRIYSGVGIPSLRTTELVGQARFANLHEVKAANSLLGLVDPIEIHQTYVCLRAAAVDGDPDAMNDLGWLWLNGARLASDPILARRLFKLAAVEGSGEALFNLAEQAYYGKGMVANPALAIDYYEQAFEYGVPGAALALGAIYEEGDEGVIADHGSAVRWYKRAVEEGDVLAGFYWGQLALNDSSTEYDLACGVYWLQWSAILGERCASEALAELYGSPFNSPPDPERRLYRFWRDFAIEQGSNTAIAMRDVDEVSRLRFAEDN
jgi:TPR repeat protein